jgi:queuine tRNA-ribosyltransferase
VDGCWTLEARDTDEAQPGANAARAGYLIARDGTALPTPLFQPVATAGSLKTLDWRDVTDLCYGHVLMNTYHLAAKPGVAAIAARGGVKAFTGWRGSVLTDSGGYQVHSLAARRSLKPDGVHFTDHIEGKRFNFSPRFVLEAQLKLGVDFAMCIDVCTGLPATRKQVARDLELTHNWAREQAQLWPELVGASGQRVAARLSRVGPAHEMHSYTRNPAHAMRSYTESSTSCGPPRLLGIVQGGLFEDLRAESAELVGSLGFDGVAVGGLAVGESPEELRRMVEFTAPLLPPDRVRYLMGVGDPADMLHAIGAGFDMFDCVQPTRMARHGVAYTRNGKLSIRQSRFADDDRPLDPQCRCRTCARHSRAYLRHLFILKEHSYARLTTWHNLALYRDLTRGARRAIVAGKYAGWSKGRITKLARDLPDGL